jgi:DHA1 family bicyclomycin/chloramphenicol resistance-like MFS transporter
MASMSVVALAIDALLPALDIIGIIIGTTNVVDNQIAHHNDLSRTGFGPLVFGPLSDSLEKASSIYGFCFVYCFICVNATSLEMMVIGRILQGAGLSAPEP